MGLSNCILGMVHMIVTELTKGPRRRGIRRSAGMECAIFRGRNQRLPVLPNQTGCEREMYDFMLLFDLQLSLFAAYHIERFHRLKEPCLSSQKFPTII